MPTHSIAVRIKGLRVYTVPTSVSGTYSYNTELKKKKPLAIIITARGNPFPPSFPYFIYLPNLVPLLSILPGLGNHLRYY